MARKSVARIILFNCYLLQPMVKISDIPLRGPQLSRWPLLTGELGWGYLRRCHEVSSRVSMGEASRNEDPGTKRPIPDASQGSQRCRLHLISR